VDDPEVADGKVSSTELEPSGAHCSAGGVAVHTGFDTDDDGILDPSEITSTTYTCNHETLLREDTLASGVTCPGGGVAVRSGHDVNDNGSLEDAEIEDTVTVSYSDELFHGDLRTSDFSAQGAQQKLSHVRVVTGNLVIDSDVAMTSLTTVGGNIDLRVGSLVELPALERVAGNLIGPPDIVLNGDRSVEHPAKLRMPVLTTVGGSVSMTSWKEGGTFSAPRLTAVDREVVLNHFTKVDLAALTRVGGRLDLDVQAEKIELPVLATVAVRVGLRGSFTELDLSALQTAAQFELYSSNLTTLSLPSLKSVGKIQLGNSNMLTTIRMPVLTGVTSFGLYQLPQLATFDLPELTSLDTFLLSNVSVIDMQPFSNLREVKKLIIQKNKELVSLRGLEQLRNVSNVSFSENAKLESFEGLEHLAKLAGNIIISKNPSLTSFHGLDGLTNVSGTITISENAALPQSEIDAFLKRLGR
jgi:hypothetical protein